MVVSNGQNSHKTCIIKCLVHLNNLKEGPIAQNIQDKLLKQLKKLEKCNIIKCQNGQKGHGSFAKFPTIRLAFWASYPPPPPYNITYYADLHPHPHIFLHLRLHLFRLLYHLLHLRRLRSYLLQLHPEQRSTTTITVINLQNSH